MSLDLPAWKPGKLVQLEVLPEPTSDSGGVVVSVVSRTEEVAEVAGRHMVEAVQVE